MSKSPQFNQQIEPKQCKREVEENVFNKTGPIAAENKWWIPCQTVTISKSTHEETLEQGVKYVQSQQ